MSAFLQSPPPVDHSDLYDDHGLAPNAQNSGHAHSSPSLSTLTRTVAIIKTHALEQRLEIEPRILEANFEVSDQFQPFQVFPVKPIYFQTCIPLPRGLADPPSMTDMGTYQIYSQIVKERQMEFDTETDPETFYELFGDDARFLGE